jgi:hypothetical protein
MDEISNSGFGSLGSRLYDIGMKWFGTAIIFALFALAAASGCLLAQDAQKLDSAMDQIVSAKAVVKRVVTGFNKWTEGPVWTRSHFLLFAEIPANNIIQWRPAEGTSIFIHPSGYTGSSPFPGPEPGSNGMTLDSLGRLTVAGHARRNVWRLESLNPNAVVTVLADTFDGKWSRGPELTWDSRDQEAKFRNQWLPNLDVLSR